VSGDNSHEFGPDAPAELRVAAAVELRALLASATVVAEAAPSRADRRGLMMTTLFATILAHGTSTARAVAAADTTAAWLLVRSAMEAFVSLQNLTRDPNYTYQLDYDQIAESLKLYQRADESEFLEGFALDPNKEVALREMLAQRDDAIAHGARRVTRREAFERVGLLGLYHGPYAFLCLQAHSNLTALADNHVRRTPTGYVIRARVGMQFDDLQLIATTMANLIADAAHAYMPTFPNLAPKVRWHLAALGGLFSEPPGAELPRT
jgi:hypothetical protein